MAESEEAPPSPSPAVSWSDPESAHSLLAQEHWWPATGQPVPFVIPIVGVGSISPELVGGKAAQLAELTALGLPVPAAFFVTTRAYRLYLTAAGLDRWLASSLERLSLGDGPGAVQLAEEVRTRFAEQPMPSEVADEVLRGYRELLTGDESHPVAVRSSANVEDGRVASFAGQCESLLNVRGPTALLEAVVACWASLHSGQALLYRARHGLLTADCAVGVVVQNLVLADRAAVAFSANPVDGDLSCVVVNASWGLGEAVVSGLVNPDCYVIAKHDLTVRSRQVADKQVMTVPLPNGGTIEQATPPDLRWAPSLSDAEAQELARVAIRLEVAREHPVDVEFAFAGRRLAVLQCRPITTL